jgi:flagellar basal body-associated protein FliL
MKKVLLLVLVLFMLIGGAVGAMVVFGIGPFKPADQAAKVPEPPKPVFVDMESISIPIFLVDKQPKQLFMTLRFEVDMDRRKVLQEKMPKVRDLILRDLHGFMPEHMRTRKAADLIVVKQRMMAVTEKILGPGIVRNILISEVFER